MLELPKVQELLSIFEGKNVFVTGHTGFKGTWLTIWLKILKANVIGYGLTPNTIPSLFNETGIENEITHIIGDIRDEEQLSKALNKYEPEFIFHLAAQPLVRESFIDPRYTFETNIMGTVNLLDIIQRTGISKVFLNITSDKCYLNNELIWGYRENETLGGHDPYSASKACSEIVTHAFRSSFFSKDKNFKHDVKIATVRAGNVVGGGDWAQDRILPDCIRSLSNNKPILIRNPDSIRPWQHVLDPLWGYLKLSALLYKGFSRYSSAWNFGPRSHQMLTVEELVKIVIEIWGSGDYNIQENSVNRSVESKILQLDCNKAFYNLNWEPKFNMREAIIQAVKWYKDYYYKESNASELCISEINSYIKLITQ